MLLVHGTNDGPATMEPLAEALRAAGRSVDVVSYGQDRTSLRGLLGGRGGIAALHVSAAQVLAAARGLLARSGAARVDLVGHSQGGLHVLACAGDLRDAMGHAVLLGTPVTGAHPWGAASHLLHRPGPRHLLDRLLGPSARGQVLGSGALPRLEDLPWQPRYLLLLTRDDRLVRPAHLAVPGLRGRIRVVWVQDVAPGRRVRHADLPADRVVQELVLDELRR